MALETTGFSAARAVAILQANFGPNYSNAMIHLLGEDGEEISPTTTVDGAAKPNGYEPIPLGELELPVDEDGNLLGYVQNKKALHFPEALYAWGTIIGFRIISNFRGVNTVSGSTYTFYSDTGENFDGALQAEKIVTAETIPLFRAGYIRIGLDHEPPAIEV